MNRKEREQINLRPGVDFLERVESFAVGKSKRKLEALQLAVAVHEGEMRKTHPFGPYVEHCIAVASIL